MSYPLEPNEGALFLRTSTTILLKQKPLHYLLVTSVRDVLVPRAISLQVTCRPTRYIGQSTGNARLRACTWIFYLPVRIWMWM